MEEYGKFHILTVEVDGLNLGDKDFVYKNRLGFIHPKDADENICCANVFIEKPMPMVAGGKAYEPQNLPRSKNAEYMLQFVGVFLASHEIVNNISLEIVFDSPSGMSFSEIERLPQLIKHPVGYHTWIKSTRSKLTVEQNLEFLKKTEPFFDKVMNILEKSKKELDPLKIALLFYQKTTSRKDILQDFVGLVTCIETLLCDKEDLSYKFAMRTSLLIETNSQKRKEVFALLRKIYRARSDLVHGNDISMFPYATYDELKEKLKPITSMVIQKYVELANGGMNNNQIKSYIDDIALGIK